MKYKILTKETRIKEQKDFGIREKRIKEVLKKNTMVIILNRVTKTLTLNTKHRKWHIVESILHEWDTKAKSFMNYFVENIVNKPIEDKEIYLGQLLMIAKKVQTKNKYKKVFI